MNKTLQKIADHLGTNVYKDPFHGQIAKDNFIYGVAQGQMEIIDWLKEHIHEYIAVGNTDYGKPEKLFEDLSKAMEE